MSRIRNASVLFLLIVFTIVFTSPCIQAATNCSAQFMPDARIVVPYATYDGTLFSATFSYGGTDNCSIWFTLEKLDLINDVAPFSGCNGATLLSDFTLHIPDLQIGGTGISLDMQYMPVSATAMPFKITGFNALASSSVSDYVIEAGQAVDLASELAISASGAVRIDGSLAPSTHTGQSITIIAEGSITITGIVAAGNGFPGGPGGTVTLHSKRGNITITETASIKAGDGGSGTACTSQNVMTAQGGSGGSIIIKAPGGTLMLANEEGLLHIGNGGYSPEVKILGNDQSAIALPESGAIRPGNSGRFDMSAQVIAGIPYQSTVMEKDIIDPTSGLPIYKKGDIINRPSSSSQFSGGKGGDAGAFIYGPGAGDATARFRVELLGYAGTRPVAGGSAISGSDLSSELPELVREGVTGGVGMNIGGKGGDVVIEGNAGILPGDKGQSVRGYGGMGGSSFSIENNYGDGGNARAIGGNGAPGSNPAGPGGVGGSAFAFGGGGKLAGTASAVGGAGGKGGGICPDNVDLSGGDGGWGGNAIAKSKEYFLGKIDNKAEATGGKAGDGGDGQFASGSYLSSGSASAEGNSQSFAKKGSDGNSGKTCPPSAHKPPQSSDIPGRYRLNGDKSADTCTNAGYSQTIYNPSVPVSMNSNGLIFNSAGEVIGILLEGTGQYSGSGIVPTAQIVEKVEGVSETIEKIEGYFTTITGGVTFIGSLQFIHQTDQQTDCAVQYSVTYTKN
jgi:hypothetical protein